MKQGDLARRFGIAVQTLTRQRSSSDFTAWSQSKDPEGIAWFYEPETKCYYTVEVERHVQINDPIDHARNGGRKAAIEV